MKGNKPSVLLHVREIAEQQGYTQTSLGRKCKLSRRTIARFWNDPSYDPTLSTLLKLAQALQCSIEALVTEPSPQESENYEHTPHKGAL